MSQGDVSSFFGGVPFDPNSVEPTPDFEALLPGKYPVLIEKSEVKPTKANNGHYIELQMVIVDGPGKGQKLWDRLNIDNPSQKAVEIALRTLSALCKATIGDEKFADTLQFQQKTCIASVTVDKGGDNKIRTYSPLMFASGACPVPPTQAPTMQPPPAQQSLVQPVGQPWAAPIMQPAQQLAAQPPQAPCGGQQVEQMQAAHIAPQQPQQPPTQQVPWMQPQQ